ncbi:MAG: hypothetical protein B6A08_03585 [Sorangiineae bacterium NIC37A_2]|nr:MAG: hypothetical protein B6A08_03585 [Sorangiineae bacterium NIC37A_2]
MVRTRQRSGERFAQALEMWVSRWFKGRWGKLRALFAGVLVAGLGIFAYLLWSPRPIAVLMEFTGRPERDFAVAMNEWSPAARRDAFFDGDAARTDKTSSASFRLGARARLFLRPDSQVRFGRRSGSGTLGVTVELGQVDVGTVDEGVRLESLFGELALEAGSTVRLQRVGSRLVASVVLGQVVLVGPSPRSLGAGESFTLELGGLVVDGPSEGVKEAARPGRDEENSAPPSPPSDLVVSAGETFWVHDPEPPTRIGFQSEGLCSGQVRLRVGEQEVQGEGTVSLSFGAGKYKYALYCTDGGERLAAEGQFDVLRDKGAKPLPAFTPSATVHADGRVYTVYYQERLPQVTVVWPSAPSGTTYELTIDGQVMSVAQPSVSLASGRLGPGTHQLVFSTTGTPKRTSRKTTVDIRVDAQATAARVAEPSERFEPGSPVSVAGQAMPGYSVMLDGTELPLDNQRRFSTIASPKGTMALAFTRPGRGTHYYLRRPKSSEAPPPSP